MSATRRHNLRIRLGKPSRARDSVLKVLHFPAHELFLRLVLVAGEQRLRAADVRHRGDGTKHADGSPGSGLELSESGLASVVIEGALGALRQSTHQRCGTDVEPP